jgi:hypothetical protein
MSPSESSWLRGGRDATRIEAAYCGGHLRDTVVYITSSVEAARAPSDQTNKAPLVAFLRRGSAGVDPVRPGDIKIQQLFKLARGTLCLGCPNTHRGTAIAVTVLPFGLCTDKPARSDTVYNANGLATLLEYLVGFCPPRCTKPAVIFTPSHADPPPPASIAASFSTQPAAAAAINATVSRNAILEWLDSIHASQPQQGCPTTALNLSPGLPHKAVSPSGPSRISRPAPPLSTHLVQVRFGLSYLLVGQSNYPYTPACLCHLELFVLPGLLLNALSPNIPLALTSSPLLTLRRPSNQALPGPIPPLPPRDALKPNLLYLLVLPPPAACQF